jgi:hypothetical protein
MAPVYLYFHLVGPHLPLPFIPLAGIHILMGKIPFTYKLLSFIQLTRCFIPHFISTENNPKNWHDRRSTNQGAELRDRGLGFKD